MCTNAQSIAGRYVLIIGKLGEMAENGDPVGDLLRATVRNCLTEMRTAGADGMEAAEIIGDLLQVELARWGAERTRLRCVLESAQVYAEYLLFAEQYSLRRREPAGAMPGS